MEEASRRDQTDAGVLRGGRDAAGAGECERSGRGKCDGARRDGEISAGAFDVWSGRKVVAKHRDFHAGYGRTVSSDHFAGRNAAVCEATAAVTERSESGARRRCLINRWSGKWGSR